MAKNILKTVRVVVIALVVVYGLVVTLLSLPSVQHHVSVAAERELSRMLGTRVGIGHITVGYPDRLIVDNLAIADRQGKELLQAARLSARFEWMPLLRHGRISIHTAQMFGLHAHVERPTPEEPMNAQFLLDALASEDTTSNAPIDLRINSLLVRRCHVMYDVVSEAHTPGVFNPHHLSVDDINATVSLKAFSKDSINAQVKRLDLTERSGFRLEGLQMHLLANTETIRLEDFDMRLPKSHIRLDGVHLNFPSPTEADTLTEQPFQIGGRTKEKSYLTPADMAPFVPALRHFHEAIHLSASIRGDNRQWEFPTLDLHSANDELALRMNRVALQFPSDTMKKAHVSASVNHLQVSQEGIPLLWHNLMGAESPVPEVLQNLQHIHFSGDMEGETNDFITHGHLKTGIGEVMAEARLCTTSDKAMTCQGHIQSDSLDMMSLLGEEQKLGTTSFNLDFKGSIGKDSPANLYLKGNIPTLQYSGYGYRNVMLDGYFGKNSFDGLLALEDPNVGLEVNGHVNLDKKIPTFDLTARIDHFRPHLLQLTSTREGHEYAAILRAHFNGNNPDNLTGTLHIDSLQAGLPRDTFFMPQLAICAEDKGNGQKLITVESEAIQARIEGEYAYETLPTSFSQILGKYLPSLFPQKNTQGRDTNNEFTFDIKLADSKLYPYVLDIPLKIHPSASLKGFISNKQECIDIRGDVPHLTYKGDEYEIGKIRCHNSPDDIKATFSIAKYMSDDARVSLIVDARATNDTLSTLLSWGNDSPITYAGSIEAETHFNKKKENLPYMQAEVKVKPSEIIINDTVWHVAPSTIRLDSGYVDIQGLKVQHGDQHLSINGRLTDKASDSLIIDLNRIATEYILDIVQFRSVNFSGQATGKIHVNGVLGDMQAHTNLRVENFHFNHGLMGNMNVSARWDKEIGVVLDADIRETDTLAITHVTGFVSPQQKGLDLQIDTRNTNLAFLNSFIGGIFADVSGRATGPIRLHGTFKELNLEGKAIATASLKPRILNTPFRITNDSVILTTDAISFPHATAFDPNGNSARVSGKVTHQHLKNMRYDFNFDLDHTCFYHTENFGDMPFYGTFYGSGDAHLRGGGNELRLNGQIRTERGTTFIYNMTTPETLTNNQFITFVDRTPRPKHFVADNLRLFQHNQEDAEEEDSPLQVFIEARIDATPDANVSVIMDMQSGDRINAYGTGDITLNYTNDYTKLGGVYTIERGEYKMSIEDVLRKDFQLQQGSKVSFTGNGGDADLNLNAIYTVNSASLSDLVPEASFNQNLVKVNCIFKMKGKLDNPETDFDLDLPTVNEEEQQIVRSAISTEEQMRTQIIYLLMVGKFYTFDYASTEGHQSSDWMSSFLSSTLSGQLNNILSQALKMDNWTFSSNFSTGQEGVNDLEVEGILNGRLLNNRLLINGNFGYRENEMRNSNFVGDFNLQYLLNSSGDFALKVYNMTNDRYFAKQTFNTQGAGLIYKREFENWRDFFKLKKK